MDEVGRYTTSSSLYSSSKVKAGPRLLLLPPPSRISPIASGVSSPWRAAPCAGAARNRRRRSGAPPCSACPSTFGRPASPLRVDLSGARLQQATGKVSILAEQPRRSPPGVSGVVGHQRTLPRRQPPGARHGPSSLRQSHDRRAHLALCSSAADNGLRPTATVGWAKAPGRLAGPRFGRIRSSPCRRTFCPTIGPAPGEKAR